MSAAPHGAKSESDERVSLPSDLIPLVLQYSSQNERPNILMALLALNYFTGNNFYDLRKIQMLCMKGNKKS